MLPFKQHFFIEIVWSLLSNYVARNFPKICIAKLNEELFQHLTNVVSVRFWIAINSNCSFFNKLVQQHFLHCHNVHYHRPFHVYVK
jgi:hypothetical protein